MLTRSSSEAIICTSLSASIDSTDASPILVLVEHMFGHDSVSRWLEARASSRHSSVSFARVCSHCHPQHACTICACPRCTELDRSTHPPPGKHALRCCLRADRAVRLPVGRSGTNARRRADVESGSACSRIRRAERLARSRCAKWAGSQQRVGVGSVGRRAVVGWRWVSLRSSRVGARSGSAHGAGRRTEQVGALSGSARATGRRAARGSCAERLS